MALDLKLEEYQELAVIALDGTIRASNADYLQSTVDTLIDDGHSRIILDCRGLVAMNSDGLAVLSDLVRYFAEHASETGLKPGKIVLCHVSPRIQELIHLSGLNQFVDTVEGRVEAIERVLH